MIDWNLEVGYSRFDTLIKYITQQGPNERVERQARVGLREFYVSPCGSKKDSDFLNVSRCNRPRLTKRKRRHRDFLYHLFSFSPHSTTSPVFGEGEEAF